MKKYGISTLIGFLLFFSEEGFAVNKPIADKGISSKSSLK